MMRLFWSPRSPFARKAVVVAHEAGLIDRIEMVPIAIPLSEPDAALNAANPLCKLPTLVTDDGQAIVDSPVIAEYLDRLGGATLIPSDGVERWSALSRQALGDEMLSILLLWRAELRRPIDARSEGLLTGYAAKLDAVLDRLEQDIAPAPQAGFTIGEITLGVLLSYLDFRFADRAWRPCHPVLTAWHAAFERRPSMIATAFQDV